MEERKKKLGLPERVDSQPMKRNSVPLGRRSILLGGEEGLTERGASAKCEHCIEGYTENFN